MGYSPQGHKESDMTKQLNVSTSLSTTSPRGESFPPLLPPSHLRHRSLRFPLYPPEPIPYVKGDGCDRSVDQWREVREVT